MNNESSLIKTCNLVVDSQNIAISLCKYKTVQQLLIFDLETRRNCRYLYLSTFNTSATFSLTDNLIE